MLTRVHLPLHFRSVTYLDCLASSWLSCFLSLSEEYGQKSLRKPPRTWWKSQVKDGTAHMELKAKTIKMSRSSFTAKDVALRVAKMGKMAADKKIGLACQILPLFDWKVTLVMREPCQPRKQTATRPDGSPTHSKQVVNRKVDFVCEQQHCIPTLAFVLGHHSSVICCAFVVAACRYDSISVKVVTALALHCIGQPLYSLHFKK